MHAFAAILASALLGALYVRGGPAWVLGFVFLVPWLRALDRSPTLGGTLLRAYGMALAFTAGAFAWFGIAIGLYAQIGATAGVVMLLLAAPLFQPQFLVFALVRHAAVKRHGALVGALAAAAAWVGIEWLLPKILGDTIGYGLYPSRVLRQGAEVAGAAGLTFMLLLANEACAAALAQRALKPLLAAAAVPALLAAWGMAAMPRDAAPAGDRLRLGLIQPNIAAYEQQRQQKGAHAVVREVLDTHFAMSYDAIERQGADAVLWSETVYPTTFGTPKSEAGAAFDNEILSIVNAAGAPFVFGTYDRDSAGEYNAAAFVQPGRGLTGFYRKSNLFPLTEHVPAWLDSPWLRRLLPWVGSWQSGNGPRVMPLVLRDGREIPVQALICYDDATPAVAIGGARLGAQALLTMSNDSWFTAAPLGARLHQSVAAFRSIETRLPQFRVTSNGYSAVIDTSGEVLAGSRMGERTLVLAAVPVGGAVPTLMVRWGDWVGRSGCVFLAALAAWSLLLSLRLRLARPAAAADPSLPARIALLPPAARAASGVLRALAHAGLIYMCFALLVNEALRINTLAQARMFATLFLAPLAASWCVLFLYAATVSLTGNRMLISQAGRSIELALDDIAAVRMWRLPLPCPGLSLQLASGQRYSLALLRPHPIAAMLAARTPGPMHAYLQAVSAARRSRFDHPLAKYALLSLVLAVPAFHLQQQIAYGGAFGEYYTYGLAAYLSGFALWWAAWAIAVALLDALRGAAVEAGTMAAALLRPAQAPGIRHSLQSVGNAALFLGLPGWLLLRVFAA